ncbi:MAG: 16S rRNA (guanine(527)-N(7))-methyltransferase RsmG [Fusobacteriaceae bacterium]
MQNYLKEGIKKIDLILSENQIELLIKYLNLLVEYNSHTNLTAIRDSKGILEKHFLDSLLVQKYIDKKDKTAIDIGTGAGFPGMVLAICNPNIIFTLIDSVGKKTKFLQMIKEELKLENVIIENIRAEEYITDENRESFSIGLCRGVSKLPTILEYMLPFIKVKGRFLVQKSEGTGEEESAQNALNLLSSKILGEYNLELPFSKDKRKIIIIEKEKITDKKYPRKTGKPLKNPL